MKVKGQIDETSQKEDDTMPVTPGNGSDEGGSETSTEPEAPDDPDDKRPGPGGL